MNLYGLTLPTAANGKQMSKFVVDLDRLRRSDGSQARMRAARAGNGKDLITRKYVMGCRVSESEQKQLQKARTKRKTLRRKLRKAGVRC